MAVFNNGTSKGFKIQIPTGGHILPSSREGERAEWKKAQKKEKKNIISETINRITPNRRPFWTQRV